MDLTILKNKLDSYNFLELKELCKKMEIPVKKSKLETLDFIKNTLQEYDNYKKSIEDKYSRKSQLGESGKEGITYLVVDLNGNEYAMKTFKKTKSHDNLRREALLQIRAAEVGVAPTIIEYDTVSKFIVMEKMDRNLLDIIKKQNGELTKKQQNQIIRLFQSLDECRVFHGDANPLNYMQKGKRLYLIDYGFSKDITPKFIKLHETETPNMKIMLLGLIIKLKELKCLPISWEILIKYVSEEDRINL